MAPCSLVVERMEAVNFGFLYSLREVAILVGSLD